MTARHIVDVAVVGGGIVGMAAALAAERIGLRVALIEQQPPPVQTLADSYDPRVYALSPASIACLGELGVWARVDASRTSPVFAMAVWGDDGGSIEFDAGDANLGSLATIVENNRLLRAFAQVLRGKPAIEVHSGTMPQQLSDGADALILELASGTEVVAALVVGADGAHSWVREQLRLETQEKSYNEFGVVANFMCERPHGHLARQWFLREGVLAWLPLPGNRISIVWSTKEPLAQELQALAPDALAERVAEAGDERLGRLELISTVAAFPLRFARVKRLVCPHAVLVGDAAHSVHPLAGQGVNLGLQDVAELGRTLAARRAPENCGDYSVLRRYERARKEPVLAMQATTDTLQRLFQSQVPGAALLRNLGLDWVNRQAWVKRRLISHAT
jgi:2-polyprenylphenol 6-hydroxylase